MRQISACAFIVFLMLVGCTRVADVVWRVTPASAIEADAYKVEALLLARGYFRSPSAEPCSQKQTSPRCEAIFAPLVGLIHVTLRYPVNGQLEIRFSEIPDGKFSPFGARLLKELSEQLDVEFGSRLSLQYPREIPR